MSDKSNPDQLVYSPTQWARVVGEHRSTVYRKIRSGELPAKKTASGMKILKEDAMNALRNLPDVMPPPST